MSRFLKVKPTSQQKSCMEAQIGLLGTNSSPQAAARNAMLRTTIAATRPA